MKYKLITNVGFADYGDARMWCHALLIDMEAHEGLGDGIRQIRGLTYGGMPVFTLWIEPDSPIEIKDAKGDTILLSNDGNAYDLGGVVVSANGRDGKPLTVRLSIDNFRGKVVIEDVEQTGCPFGDEVDDRILPHAGGSAYPRVEWTLIPSRLKRPTQQISHDSSKR